MLTFTFTRKVKAPDVSTTISGEDAMVLLFGDFPRMYASQGYTAMHLPRDCMDGGNWVVAWPNVIVSREVFEDACDGNEEARDILARCAEFIVRHHPVRDSDLVLF